MTISAVAYRRSESPSEPSHQFAVGQTVRLIGGFRPSQNMYVIVAKLPPNEGSPQYRIRSEAEGFERMTTEANLEAVDTPIGDDAVLA